MKKIIVIVLVSAAVAAGGWLFLDVRQVQKEVEAVVLSRIEKLKDERPLSRGIAALKLGEMRGNAVLAIPALIDVLDDNAKLERSLDGRGTGFGTSPGREAGLALARIGDEAIDPLQAALESTNTVVRTNASFGLGEMLNEYDLDDDKEIIYGALKSVLDDPVPAVRRNAIEYLRSDLDWLMNSIGDPDAGVRAPAINKLGLYVGNMQRTVAEDPAVLALIAAVNDPHALVRGDAAYVLRIVKDSRSPTNGRPHTHLNSVLPATVSETGR